MATPYLTLLCITPSYACFMTNFTCNSPASCSTDEGCLHHVTCDVMSWTTRYTSETNLSSNMYTNSDLQGNRCQDDQRSSRNGPTTALYVHYSGRQYCGLGFLPAFVCLSVRFPHDISKRCSAAAEITKVDTEMFQDEPWKSIRLEVRWPKVKVTSHKNSIVCQRGCLHSCECYLLF